MNGHKNRGESNMIYSLRSLKNVAESENVACKPCFYIYFMGDQNMTRVTSACVQDITMYLVNDILLITDKTRGNASFFLTNYIHKP